MKKGFKIALLSVAMLFVGGGVTCACAQASKQESVICVRAEEEFVEKTYTFECPDGTAVIVLKSPNECEITLTYNGEEPVTKTFSCVRVGNVLTIDFDGEEMRVELNDETMTFIEYIEELSDEDKLTEDEKTFKEWAVEKWETFVAPLVGGISLTAILSFAMTMFFNWLKNKKLDEKLVDVKNNLNECQLILKTLTGIYDNVKETREINEETQGALKEAVEKILSMLNLNNEKMDKIEKIQPILKLLVELETKVAKASDEAIKAGIIDDVREIESLIKNF